MLKSQYVPTCCLYIDPQVCFLDLVKKIKILYKEGYTLYRTPTDRVAYSIHCILNIFKKVMAMNLAKLLLRGQVKTKSSQQTTYIRDKNRNSYSDISNFGSMLMQELKE